MDGNETFFVAPQWLHVKSGGLYEEIGRATFAAGFGAFVPVMVYRSLKDGAIWVRNLGEFLDGRFECTRTGEAAPLYKVHDGLLECDQSPVHIVPSGDGTLMVFRKGTLDVA